MILKIVRVILTSTVLAPLRVSFDIGTKNTALILTGVLAYGDQYINPREWKLQEGELSKERFTSEKIKRCGMSKTQSDYLILMASQEAG